MEENLKQAHSNQAQEGLPTLPIPFSIVLEALAEAIR